jgi:hypothetical protein
LLALLLNGMTVDQLLNIIHRRLIGMAMPIPTNWIL